MHGCFRVAPKSLSIVAFLMLCGVVLAGCGGDPSKTNVLKGKVTIDGQPAYGVTVVLNYDDGKTHAIPVSPDASFRVQGVPLGKAVVTITSKFMDPEKMPAEMKAQFEALQNSSTANVPGDKQAAMQERLNIFKAVPIPERYADSKTSGLTLEIAGGMNEKDFELKK
jgi:hypothetical protein